MILGTCSTIEIIICLKKNQSTPRPSEHPPVMGEKMSKRYILSSTYQNEPGPSRHTNIKLGSEAAIVTLVLGSDGIYNLLVYSIIQYYITIVINTCIQYNYYK